MLCSWKNTQQRFNASKNPHLPLLVPIKTVEPLKTNGKSGVKNGQMALKITLQVEKQTEFRSQFKLKKKLSS